jgi:hypothetical protein
MCGLALSRAQCAVDGIFAERATGALRSSPEAAKRFAGGEGLDRGAPDRSTIDHAACLLTPSRSANCASATPRIYTPLTDTTLPL